MWASSNISMSGLVWYCGSSGVTVIEGPLQQCPQMQFNMASKYFSLELCLHRPGFKADRPMVYQQPRHTASNMDKLIFFHLFVFLKAQDSRFQRNLLPQGSEARGSSGWTQAMPAPTGRPGSQN